MLQINTQINMMITLKIDSQKLLYKGIPAAQMADSSPWKSVTMETQSTSSVCGKQAIQRT